MLVDIEICFWHLFNKLQTPKCNIINYFDKINTSIVGVEL